MNEAKKYPYPQIAKVLDDGTPVEIPTLPSKSCWIPKLTWLMEQRKRDLQKYLQETFAPEQNMCTEKAKQMTVILIDCLAETL